MKTMSKIVVLLLLLALAVCTATACGPDATDLEISIKEDGMPQVTFVQGQDLDLSNGVLQVKQGDEVTELPLDSEGITASGYNKDTLGEQTVTIEYQGKTTQIKVTVVPRMQVVDHVTDYLVGDTLDLSKGRVKITRDDGTTYTVLLNNASVTVQGFQSANAAAPLTLTVGYRNGTESYSASFNVTVHAIDGVSLHKPTKLAYNSHEGGLDLSGGYLTLTGNGGKLSRNVPLTQEIVQGFDLGAVNEINTPLDQTLTVTYNGHTESFAVKLVYTAISQFKKNASTFTALNWSGTTAPAISADKGELALDMVALYLDMTKAEKTFITEAEYMSVARAAMVYGYDVWSAEMQRYPDVFAIEGGQLALYCKSYEAVKQAAQALDEQSLLATVTPVLVKMIETFGTATVVGNTTFADYAVADLEAFDLFGVLPYMVELFDQFAAIKADWPTVGANTYATEIENVVSFIMSSGYSDATYSQIYGLVSAWRENDDAFDVLYAYYGAKNDIATMTTLAALRLPAELEEIFNYALGAWDQINGVSQFEVFDTTWFFYYYTKAVSMSEQIKNGDNELVKQLYRDVPLNGLLRVTDQSTQFYFDTLLEYLRTTEGGYRYFSGGLLGMDTYHALMDRYMDVVSKYMDVDGYEASEDYRNDVYALFDMFVALTPTQQLNFLATLNIYYTEYPTFAFDDSGDNEFFISIFAQMVNECYRALFTDTAVAAYNDLVRAIEIYAQRFYTEDWLTSFTAKIDSVTALYTMMEGADKAAFEQHLLNVYNQYLAIRTAYNTPDSGTELGDWATVFEELENALIDIDNASYLFEVGYLTAEYDLLLSAFERAQAIADLILTTAPEEIKYAYSHEELYVVEYSAEEKYSFTYEYVLNTYRSNYIDTLIGSTGGYDVYDAYVKHDMGAFLDSIYDLLWLYVNNYIFSEQAPTVQIFDRAEALAALDAFHKIDLEGKIVFAILEGNLVCYYRALNQFFVEQFSENAAAVASKMLELEQNLIYLDLSKEEDLEALKTVLVDLETLYGALEGEDKTSFADLEAAYADRIEAAEAAIAAAEAEANA